MGSELKVFSTPYVQDKAEIERQNRIIKDVPPMTRLWKRAMRLVCRVRGHKWDYYIAPSFPGAYWPWDYEQAGCCARCGYDTHAKEG